MLSVLPHRPTPNSSRPFGAPDATAVMLVIIAPQQASTAHDSVADSAN